MLGRAPETVGGADTALLQQAAMALLAGEGEAPSDQVLKRLGLTDFAVGQKTDADNVKQTVVSLGRQVSKRIYVGYERSVTAAAGNWQLIYRIAQRLTLRAQAGVEAATTRRHHADAPRGRSTRSTRGAGTEARLGRARDGTLGTMHAARAASCATIEPLTPAAACTGGRSLPSP